MKVRPKAIEFDAWEMESGQPPFWIAHALLVGAVRRHDKGLEVVTPTSSHVAKPGDWILMGPDKKLFVMSKAHFDFYCARVFPTDGTENM